MQFGKNIRNLWNINFDTYKFFNHGSFGATPKVILEKMHEINQKIEEEPLLFFLDTYPDLLNQNICTLANFLGTTKDNIVLTDNATTGVNTILENIIPDLKNDEILFYTNHIYPAVRNTILYKSHKYKVNIHQININYPIISKEEIIEKIDIELKNKKGILVIDQISSPTALVFPINEINKICKKYGIKLLVDGAHSPGMINLNLDELNVDYFVGNCHKWLYSGKGSAFIYSDKKNLEKFHPLVISNDFGLGYRKEFDWQGTKNPSSWLTIKESIEFYNQFGFDGINTYNTELIKNISNLYQNSIENSLIINLSNYLWLISLPFPYFATLSTDANAKLRNYFLKKYGIEIMFVIFENKLYMRYAAQIYNDFEDSVYLIECVKDFIKNFSEKNTFDNID